MGRLFVVSAPSGAGKTTLCRRLTAALPDLAYSVSYTTRQARPGEQDGVDYHFIETSRFRRLIEAGEFLEWAEVFGRYYGTGRSWVEARLTEGRDVLVDIDVAGARQIRENFPEAVLIFVLPPTLDELGRRLQDRHTETAEQLELRLGRVKEEIEARDMYDYLVVNDDKEQATSDLAAILRAEHLCMNRAGSFWDRFFKREP